MKSNFCALAIIFIGIFMSTSSFAYSDDDTYVEFSDAISPSNTNGDIYACSSNSFSHKELRFYLINCRSEKDFQQKLNLYEGQKNDSVLCLLGREFRGDFGGNFDLYKSRKLFEASSSKGNINAIYFLGDSYENNNECNLKAFVYLSLSALRGVNVNPPDLGQRIDYHFSTLNSSEKEKAFAAINKLYFSLRAKDAMRFPSLFSISTPSSSFLHDNC